MTSDYGKLQFPIDIAEGVGKKSKEPTPRDPVKQPQKEELIVMKEEYKEWIQSGNKNLFNIFDLFDNQGQIKGYYDNDMIGLNIHEFNKAFLKLYTFIFIKYSQNVDKDQLDQTLERMGNKIDEDKSVPINKLLTMEEVKDGVKEYVSSLALSEKELLSHEKEKLLKPLEEKVDKIVSDIMDIESQDTPNPQEQEAEEREGKGDKISKKHLRRALPILAYSARRQEEEGEESPENPAESMSPQEGEGGVDQGKGYPTPETTELDEIKKNGATFIKKDGDEEIRGILKIGTKYQYTSGKAQKQKKVIGFELKSDKGEESYFLVTLPIYDDDDGEESTDEEDEEGEESDKESISFKYFYDTRFKNPSFEIIPEAPTQRTPTSSLSPKPPTGPPPATARPKNTKPPGPLPRPDASAQYTKPTPPPPPRSDNTSGIRTGRIKEKEEDSYPQGGGRKLRRKKRTNKKRRSVRKNIPSKRKKQKKRTQKRRTQKRRTQKRRTQKKRNVNKRY